MATSLSKGKGFVNDELDGVKDARRRLMKFHAFIARGQKKLRNSNQ
jgi:hypothetical protein